MDLDLGSNVSGLSELAAAVRAAAPQPKAGGKKGKKGKREYEEEGGGRGGRGDGGESGGLFIWQA